MTKHHELESFYKEAQSALKAKDYDRAAELLKQILKADVEYKNASRLLAQTVKLRRRRWHNDARIWGGLGISALILVIILAFPKIETFYASRIPLNPTATSRPTSTAIPTITPTPTPTPIPLVWKRIYIGQEFLRDKITAIAANPKDKDVIYVGTANAGIYKTIDGGLSWSPAFNGIDYPKTDSLLIDPHNPSILYAATDQGAYKTDDGGQNWRMVKSDPAQYIAMDPQNSTHLYFYAPGWVFESRDSGETLTNNYFSSSGDKCPNGWYTLAIHPLDGNTLYTVEIRWGFCEPGVYQSNDAGRTWDLIGLGGIGDLHRITAGTDFNGNVVLYVESESGSTYISYISYDGGQTWDTMDFGCNLFTIDPQTPTKVYCNENGLTFSEDGGHSWQSISISANNISAIGIDSSSANPRLMVGENSLFVSPDLGVTWSELANGLGGSKVSIKINLVDPSNMYVIVFPETRPSYCSLYRSLDRGKSWTYVFDIQDCVPSFDKGGKFYVVKDGQFVMSADKGMTWSDINPPQDQFQTAIINPSIPGLAYWILEQAKGLIVRYSTDYGQSWSVSDGIPSEVMVCGVTHRLFFSNDGNTVYLNTCNWMLSSIDAGKTWEYGGMEFSVAGVEERLAVNPQDGNLFYMGKGERDGGICTCRLVDNYRISTTTCKLENTHVNSIAIDPNNPDTIYVGADSGAYVSFDGGQTWGQINDGLLGATVVYSIVVDKEGNVYAATPYGIFKLEGK